MSQMQFPGMENMPETTSVTPRAPHFGEGAAEKNSYHPTLDREWQLMGAKKTVNGMPWTPEWSRQTVDTLKDADKAAHASGDDYAINLANVRVQSLFHNRQPIAEGTNKEEHPLSNAADDIKSANNLWTNEDWTGIKPESTPARNITFEQGWLRARDVLHNMGEAPEGYKPKGEEEAREDAWDESSAQKSVEGSALPRMTEVGNTKLLSDGHHRVSAAFIRGDEQITARIARDK